MHRRESVITKTNKNLNLTHASFEVPSAHIYVFELYMMRSNEPISDV